MEWHRIAYFVPMVPLRIYSLTHSFLARFRSATSFLQRSFQYGRGRERRLFERGSRRGILSSAALIMAAVSRSPCSFTSTAHRVLDNSAII